MVRKDLGMVTAYAYAVSKGYTGTEAEFAELMASYASVAQEAVDAALASAQSAQAAASARDTAQTTVAGAIAGIQAEGQTQVDNVNAAGATQIAAVEAKGRETRESIPDDYTTLANTVDSHSDEIDDLNAAVNAIVSSSDLKPEDIAQIVQTGGASKFFTLGDQIATTWQKGNAQLDLPLDIVAFHDIATQGGETKKAMWLQSHWAVDAVQFDASEAIYYCDEALPAGTYHFVIGTTWGTHCIKDKAYSFTTTQEIPAHGQIVIGTNTGFYTWGAPDKTPEDWRVYTFSDATSITPIETLTLTEAANGTLLGTLSSATKYGNSGMNNLQRAAYGYNRWSQSAIRQWLNSAAPAGEWWTPQNVFDRPPQQLATLPGFMAGLPNDIKAILKPIKVTTALNTVSDTDIGASEDTYDIFFCPSLEQEYIVPQAAGVEGAYWPYWKERLELDSPQAQGSAGTNENHIRYAIENHNSAQYVRLRSAYRSNACHTWYMSASGYATYGYYATNAPRPAPACAIY